MWRTVLIGILGCAIAWGQWTTDWETIYVPNVVTKQMKKEGRFFIDSLYRAYAPGKYVTAIAFAGRDTCFLATAFNPSTLGAVLRTTDYGKSWDSVYLSDERSGVKEQQFVDLEWDGYGRIYGLLRFQWIRYGRYWSKTVLLWSDDLGEHWESIVVNDWFPNPPGRIVSVHCFDLEMWNKQEGVITAVMSEIDTVTGRQEYDSVLIYTRDRWASVDTVPGIGFGVSTVDVVGAGQWVVHNYDRIGWTTDYGQHWQVVDMDSVAQQWGWSASAFVVQDVAAIDLDQWYVCANYYPLGRDATVIVRDVILSVRGRGKEIRRLLDTLPVDGPWGGMRSLYYVGALYEMEFLDSLRGVVVGSGNQVWMTSDGGESWERQGVDLIPAAEAYIYPLFGAAFRRCAYGDTDRIVVGGIEYAVIYRPGQMLRRPWIWGQHRRERDTVAGVGELEWLSIRTKTVTEVPMWLRWSEVEGAERYRIVMYDDSTEKDDWKKPPEKVMDTVVSDTAIGLWVRADKDHVAIYVRAEGGGKVSNWWQLLWRSKRGLVGVSGDQRVEGFLGRIYPNPSRGRMWVRYPEAGRWRVEVRDVMGRVVWEEGWKERGEGEVEEIRIWESGTYYIRVIGERWRWDEAVVVIR